MLEDLIRDVLWAKAHVLIRGGYMTRPAWRFVRACESEIPIPENLRRLARGHYAEPDLEPERVARVANMDGDDHREGDCCKLGHFGAVCTKCGGRVHRQPVYGGIAELCEGCPEDAHYWHTPGDSEI